MNRTIAFSAVLLVLGVLLAAGGFYFRGRSAAAQKDFDTRIAPCLAELAGDLRAADAYREAVQGMVLRGEGTVDAGVSPRGFFPAGTLLRIDPPAETACRNAEELRIVAQTLAFQGTVEVLSAALSDCRKAGFRVVALSLDPAANGTVRADLTLRSFHSSQQPLPRP